MKLAEILRGLGDVLFPPSCVRCRGLVEDSGYRHVCARCARRIDFIGADRCPICGHPGFGAAAGPGCPICAELDPAFGSGCAAVLLRGAARDLLAGLKYRGRRHLLGDIEEVFRRSPVLLAHAAGAVLVPVPLHPRKLRERGFNQSELLCRALMRAAGGKLRMQRLLRRTADTPTQTALDRRGRRDNLKNAFALRSGAGFDRTLRYLLVDDVFTTGSTLNGCARVLRRAGCLNLDVAAFGRG